MENKITTIICFCSNDQRYIGKCIDEAAYFSDEVIVPVCDHFFDGSKEDISLLQEIYSRHPEATFVQFAYDPIRSYSPYLPYGPKEKEWSSIWHATSRYVGFVYARTSSYYLFLDCDEIIEGKKFASWLSSGEYMRYSALRFLCYRYFYLPHLRSKVFHHNALLMRGSELNMTKIIQPYERYGTYFKSSGEKKERIALGDEPMFHHYNWVKNKEEMLKKAATWGHRWEKNWEELIENFFSEKKLVDFAFDEPLEEAPVFFDPFSHYKKRTKKKRDNVIYTTRQKVFEKMVDRESGTPL